MIRSAGADIWLLVVPEPESEEIGSKEDYEDLLELPTDPINFEAENWDDDPDGEGELDLNLGLENESALSNSNYSSVTLSSKASKRSFDEVDSVGDEDGHTDGTLSPTSPGAHLFRFVLICTLIYHHHRSKTISDSLTLSAFSPKQVKFKGTVIYVLCPIFRSFCHARSPFC